MKTRDKVMIVIAVLVMLVAGVLTAVGVVTHREPVFTDDTKAWSISAFPLKVRASRYTSVGDAPLDSVQATTLEDAISIINSRLDFDTFVMANEDQEPDITIDVGVPYESEWEAPGGQYRLLGRGVDYTSCQISTSNTGTAELLFWTLQHELGHCLGLAHDPFELSIMYPEQSPVEDLRNRPWITDADRKALREKYASAN